MRVVATSIAAAIVAALPFAGGCGVQQDRYDQLLHAHHSLQEQNIALSDERDAAVASRDAVSSELAEARTTVRTLQQRNQQLGGEIGQMQAETDQILSRVSNLELGPLPPEVEVALSRLAQRYPQLLSFDADRGMLRFASDFTFALGSAELQTEAAATLSALAEILTSPAAQNLEVRVVGHTDNVPIGKPETRQKHPTNVHLSVHRAISVRERLVGSGVDPVRILVAGYGESRPIAVNGPKGSEANRRVEVFLAPMAGQVPAQSAEQRMPQNEVRVDEGSPMK